MGDIEQQKTIDEPGECDQQVDSIPMANLSVDDLTPIEEDVLLKSDDDTTLAKTGKKPVKRLSRGELRRKRIEEALAKGERVLSKKERRLAWAAKNPHSASGVAGASGNQDAGKEQGVSGTPKADAPGPSGEKGGKRGRDLLTPEDAGGEKKKTKTKEGEGSSVSRRAPAPTYSEKLSVEKMAIARTDHPEVQLTEAEANRIKMELSRRAILSKDVRISSCHLEGGALVVGCTNATTKEWLVKQVQELSPLGETSLQIAPAKSLVKVVKVSTFVPSSTGARTKKDVMLGLKLQNDLVTDHWTVVGGNSNPDGQFLVMIIDDPSLQKLRSLAMRPFLGCERITFRLHGRKEPPK